MPKFKHTKAICGYCKKEMKWRLANDIGSSRWVAYCDCKKLTGVKVEKRANLKDYIEFIRIQYKDLKTHKGISREEYCLKIEEMLCHILYLRDKELKNKK